MRKIVHILAYYTLINTTSHRMFICTHERRAIMAKGKRVVFTFDERSLRALEVMTE